MKRNSSSENQHIEWKTSWRDEYIKWLCGFANAKGGTLVIGKNDKGEITGIRDAQKLLEEIPNKVRDLLGIIVEVNLRTSKGKDFLEILTDAYPHPVSYKGEYHYRTGSTKQILKGAALDAFLLKKYGLHWDSAPLPKLAPDQLETKAFKLFTQKAVQSDRLGDEILKESREALLKKLHLFEGPYLKRAGALLFYEDPEEFITGAFIKIGFFRTDVDLLYQDEIRGNLFHQVDTALDLLLTKYMKAYIDYEGIQRVGNNGDVYDFMRFSKSVRITEKRGRSSQIIQSQFRDYSRFSASARSCGRPVARLFFFRFLISMKLI